MFKYGGPINEGVMHGMRSNYAGGQRVGAFNVGSPVKGMFPKDAAGREHHVAPAVGAGIWYGAQGLARLAPTLYRAITGAKNISRGRSLVPTGGTGSGAGASYNIGTIGGTPNLPMVIPQVSRSGKVLNKIKDWFKADPLYSTVAGGTTMLGRGIKGGGKKIGQFAKYSTTTPSGLLFFGAPVTIAGGKWLLSDGTELNDNQKRQVKQVGPPGGGDPDMTYTKPPVTKSAAELAAEAKAARTAKLEKYLDTMGYDKAKKTAMGDALIDASAIVQDATTEAGSLKKADWGKMINKAIQTTSKRLDKPEQIREAVGLMMTKADIEKDMEDPQTKELRRLQIAGAEKALAGKTTSEILQERMLKGDYPAGKNLARLVSINNPGANLKVIPSTGIKPDKDTIEYITEIVEANQDKGTPFPPGNYVIKDQIIQIDETGTVTPIPISAFK